MPQTRFLAVPGGQLAYDDTGTDGPLVVLLPGLGDRRQSYRLLRPALELAGYRVATMDLRGHGESTTGWNEYSQTAVGLDVIALLEHLDGGRAVLVGNSYAGGAVVWAAAQAPTLVAGIVPMNAFVRSTPKGPVLRLLTRAFAASPRLWVAGYGRAHPSAPPADLAEYRAVLAATLAEPGRRKALAAMLLGPMTEGERWSRSVNCPALVVMGAKDSYFPDPAAEAGLQARMLDCEARLIEDAGHYPHSEFPDRTAGVMLPFLRDAFDG
ncbi:alpha/beta hydrolase [Solihabitans fulvus]|uniref:Alpha/beta hydrolase n=1 Tax=Solihabitans fulvus TaxID=1892852 RepID=A0A5B2WWK8_9PSEU|nr:alpha/beta hydrolase [Solihabitans fulvus]KAA2255458.1 alpha/beta hydrolase [Solihabitans fulvus]